MSEHLSSLDESVSALADGQLGRDDLDATLAHCQAGALAAWGRYHLIGDAMRHAAVASGSDDARFLARLRTGLAAAAAPGTPLPPSGAPRAGRFGDGAANDPVFRWRMVAGVATLAAALSVGWGLWGGTDAGRGGATLARDGTSAQPVRVVGLPDGQVIIRDPALEELLAAHRRFGAASVLQTPAGFLRNATFEVAAPADGR